MVWFYGLDDLEGQAQSAAILTKTERVPRYMPGENLKSVLMRICVNLCDSNPNLPYHINKLKWHTSFDKLFWQPRKWSFIRPMFLSASVRWMDCTPHPRTTPTPTPPPHTHTHTSLAALYHIVLHLQLASYQIRKIAVCACVGNAGNVFPTTDFKGNC